VGALRRVKEEGGRERRRMGEQLGGWCHGTILVRSKASGARGKAVHGRPGTGLCANGAACKVGRDRAHCTNAGASTTGRRLP
jgi:hypothetical protein